MLSFDYARFQKFREPAHQEFKECLITKITTLKPPREGIGFV